MLSKSPTFHVSTRHIYEHELKHLPYHQNHHPSQQQSETDELTLNLNQYTKHNQHQVLNSNMFRSEIMFNSKKTRSQHTDVSTITYNNVSSISPTNSCFTISSNDNHIAYELNDIIDNDEEVFEDNDSDNDINDDGFYNKDEVDELFFFIPTISSNEVKYGNQLKQNQSIPFTLNTNDIHKSYDDSFNLQISPKLPTLKERITHTQNIWCLPNLSRLESEKLLEFAEIGNFIVRVNQQNSSMVLTRVCPPTTVLRSPNKTNDYLHVNHKGYIENNHNKNQHHNVYLPIKHNLIEILPHDGYCLTGDKKIRLIFKSLIHLLEFYLLVQVSNRASFLRLPSAICQAKTMNELDQLNKQGIKMKVRCISFNA